jgi:dihydrofolate reductase
MRKIVVGTFLSLDGVMQAPGSSEEDTEGGFDYGGWQMPYFDEIAGKVVGDSFAATDALLLGRVTYQIFAAYWPNAPAEDPFATRRGGEAEAAARFGRLGGRRQRQTRADTDATQPHR